VNKADLVAEVAKLVDSKRIAEEAVSCVFNTITKAMKKGQAMTLVGFGTFSVGKRKARVGRNPQTGKEIKIPAKKVPKFSAGKALKDAVKKS
jgi:DNA-binding protein HU-beta